MRRIIVEEEGDTFRLSDINEDTPIFAKTGWSA